MKKQMTVAEYSKLIDEIENLAQGLGLYDEMVGVDFKHGDDVLMENQLREAKQEAIEQYSSLIAKSGNETDPI